MPDIISGIDMNSFAHFWKDGIKGGHEDVEIMSHKRCKLLIGYARARRLGLPTTTKNIAARITSRNFPDNELEPIITDFCKRGIMREGLMTGGEITLGLFEKWLVDKGVNELIADHLGEDLQNEK